MGAFHSAAERCRLGSNAKEQEVWWSPDERDSRSIPTSPLERHAISIQGQFGHYLPVQGRNFYFCDGLSVRLFNIRRSTYGSWLYSNSWKAAGRASQRTWGGLFWGKREDQFGWVLIICMDYFIFFFNIWLFTLSFQWYDRTTDGWAGDQKTERRERTWVSTTRRRS